MPYHIDLTGEVALVTGAAGRLGRVWCQALRDAGATVLETDHPRVKGGFFGKSSAWYGNADITDEREVRRIALDFEPSGRPTILVNNAGVDDRPGMGVEVWPRYELARDMALTNLVGTYICTTVFGEWMVEAGKGVVINIASLYGLVAPDDALYTHLTAANLPPGAKDAFGYEHFHKHPMYGATKAGIVSLTKYFAALWGPKGIRVNAVAPGGVVDLGDPLTGSDAEFRRKYTAKIPMRRMCVPDDLVGPLLFLASSASSFMTGQTLVLDGGFTAW